MILHLDFLFLETLRVQKEECNNFFFNTVAMNSRVTMVSLRLHETV